MLLIDPADAARVTVTPSNGGPGFDVLIDGTTFVGDVNSEQACRAARRFAKLISIGIQVTANTKPKVG